MIQHLSIATLESFLWGMQPFCLIHHIKAHISKSDIDFLDDHYVGAYFSQLMMDLSHDHPSKKIIRHFSHWSMRHDWHISVDVLYGGAYFSIDDVFWGIAILWR